MNKLPKGRLSDDAIDMHNQSSTKNSQTTPFLTPRNNPVSPVTLANTRSWKDRLLNNDKFQI
jgi:hypothetical protein